MSFPILSMGEELSGGVDVLTRETFSSKGIGLYESIDYGVSGTYSAEGSGTDYYFNDFYASGHYLCAGYKGYITNTTSVGYIHSVAMNSDKTFYTYMYVSPNPFTPEQILAPWDFEDDGVTYVPRNTRTDVYEVEGAYRYFLLKGEGKFSNLTMTWSGQSSVLQCEPPVFYAETYLGCPSGTKVDIKCATPGATIEYKVITPAGQQKYTGEAPVQYELVGKPGDVIRIQATAMKEGMYDSDQKSATYTITIPGLERPKLNVTSWDTQIPLGGDIVITNPNGVGQIEFQVCDDWVYATDQTELHIAVEGTVGEMWRVIAMITADGYTDSDKVEWIGEIIDNQLMEPYFEPDGGSVVPAGTKVRVRTPYDANSLTYRVDGGEWITVETTEDVFVEITKSTTIEAYCEGPAPYTESEVAFADYQLEELGPNQEVIAPATFGIVPFAQEKVHKTTFGGNEYEYYGQVGSSCFYFERFSNKPNYLRNTVSTSGGIVKIKVDIDLYCVALYFSDEPIESTEGLTPVYIGAPISAVPNPAAETGEWLDLRDYDKSNGTAVAGKKYFYICTAADSYDPMCERVTLQWDDGTSVSAVEVAGKEGDIYDICGRRVSDSSNLAPGVYIRNVGGKSEKLIIK